MQTSAAEGEKPLPRFAIFTDFDGTLVELAETPDGIEVPKSLATHIEFAREALGGAVAVISGRALSDLALHIPPAVPAAGGHGTERRLADGEIVGPTNELMQSVERLYARLQPLAEGHEGLLLEHKPASVALHFRLAPELEATCLTAMQQALADEPGFELLQGKMVLEARPVGISKADAMRSFMLEPPFAGRVPVFFGDDTTDEDGFRAAQELGGVGVKVGPGDTIARTRVADVEAAIATIVGLATRTAEAEENA